MGDMLRLRKVLTGGRPFRSARAIYLALLLSFSLLLLASLPAGFRQFRGFEYAEVAQNFAEGHGFSFSSAYPWLFPDTEPGVYRLTNYPEPLYPLLLGSFQRAWGPAGIRTVLTLQAVFLIATSLVLYKLGSTAFSPWVGMFASLLLLASPNVRLTAVTSLSNAILAGLFISLSIYVIFRVAQRPSLWRGLLAGGVVGLASLTHSTALALAPLAGLYLWLVCRPAGGLRWRLILVFLAAWAVVISPWAIRNGLVFGTFTPARTGLGWNSFIGGPLLAETFDGSYRACPEGEPAWRAGSPAEAVAAAADEPRRQALYQRGDECFMQLAPAGWPGLNEVQRDGILLRAVLHFMAGHPGLWLALFFQKILFFISLGGLLRGILTVMAFLGLLVSLRSWQGALMSAYLLLYLATYGTGISFFFRYRYPVEPVLLLLAAVALVAVVSAILRILFRRAISSA